MSLSIWFRELLSGQDYMADQGTTFLVQGACSTSHWPGVPSPDSRIIGLGDEGAQLFDPIVNVESPASFNFQERGRKRKSRKESSMGKGKRGTGVLGGSPWKVALEARSTAGLSGRWANAPALGLT